MASVTRWSFPGVTKREGGVNNSPPFLLHSHPPAKCTGVCDFPWRATLLGTPGRLPETVPSSKSHRKASLCREKPEAFLFELAQKSQGAYLH